MTKRERTTDYKQAYDEKAIWAFEKVGAATIRGSFDTLRINSSDLAGDQENWNDRKGLYG
jgi:hypothetical protein